MDFHLSSYSLSAPRPHGKRPAGKCGSPSESVAKIGRKCKVPMPSHIFLGSCTTKNSSRKHRTMVWPPFGPEKRLCPVGNTGVPRRSSEGTVENLWGYAYRSSHKSGSCHSSPGVVHTSPGLVLPNQGARRNSRRVVKRTARSIRLGRRSESIMLKKAANCLENTLFARVYTFFISRKKYSPLHTERVSC